MDKRTLLFMLCVTAAYFGLNAWFDAGKPPSKPIASSSQNLPEKKLQASREIAPSSKSSRDGEIFYVLENEYQQLVFSTRGGALAEINLPLKQEKESKSLVKEVDIDREILATSPQNSRFPLSPYYTPSSEGKMFHAEGKLGGYYPLLRRDLLNSQGAVKNPVSPDYYALQVVGGEIGNFKVTRFEENLIQFEGSVGGQKVVKTYTIPQERSGPYCLLLTVEVKGDAEGLWLSSGIPDVELLGGSYSPLLKYQFSQGKLQNEVEEISLPRKQPLEVTTLRPNWISNSNGFFGLILDPLSPLPDGYRALQISGAEVPTRLSLIDAAYQLYPPADYPGYATYLPLKGGEALTFRIFAGPYDESLLKDLDELYQEPLDNYNPDYSSAQSIQGWFSFISRPFAQFLSFLIQIFYAITRSWAASILLLTVALRAMMYPLNSWSIRSSAKMQAIAPKVKAIQERYKKDPKKGQLEVMNLYRESGVNPITGCLPLFLQMPFLIGMFYLLKSSFPLRGAMFIPGWIDDLAAPDILFSWGQPFWIIGNELHLLPILMGGAMYLQQRLSTKLPANPAELSDLQKQQKMMGLMMPLLFTVMFYNVPSGLNLYFMLSTLLGIAQQEWMNRKYGLKGTAV